MQEDGEIVQNHTDADIGFGNIRIPDISGFTRFVTQIDILPGQAIIRDEFTS